MVYPTDHISFFLVYHFGDPVKENDKPCKKNKKIVEVHGNRKNTRSQEIQ